MKYKFNNVSLNSLPKEIKFEFEKVLTKYKELNIGVTEKSENCLFDINLLNDFKSEFKKDTLFVEIHNNQLYKEKRIIQPMFEKRIENKNPYYKAKIEECINWYLDKYYSNSFIDGYNTVAFIDGEDFFENSKNERLEQSVYNVIKNHKPYRNLNNIYTNFFKDIKVIDPLELILFAKTEGEYIKAWEIVLQYPKRFINLFTNVLTQTKLIDLSNTKGTEKIIMLKQLGILDFLKEKQPFNISTNALANALSGVTGIDVKTLQSYINPIINPGAKQKNNPLKSEKSVNKVRQKLIEIGFNPLK